MAFRELSMLDVRELLRRWQAGQSARLIARDGVADRKTAHRYIKAALKAGLTTTGPIDEDAIARVMAAVQTRPTPSPSAERAALTARGDQIRKWIGGDEPLRLSRVHELLKREGVEVGYTTLRRFAHEELGWRERAATVRVDDPPFGEEAQIDFGLLGYVQDSEGRRQKLWALVVVLSASRYMFVWPTFKQTVEAVCEGLDAAWRFFGGVPRRVVPDNMSAIVMRARPKEPLLNRAFAEYAQSRGFFVDPARVRSPQDKARVENQIAFVRERWFAGENFSADLAELRPHAERWCRDVAGARLHGTTRRVPRDVFEAEEKPRLMPPPTEAFDVPRWSTATVQPDHHAQVDRALYSLPEIYRKKKVEARADAKTVRFYFAGETIKIHARVGPGERSTDPNDYPKGRAVYALRDIGRLVTDARHHGEHVGAYAERLLAGPLPWTRMRQATALLRLCERFGADRVDALCERSLAFDVVDVPRIERMIKTAHRIEETATSSGKIARLPAGRFARDAAEFATTPSKDGGAR